MTYLSPEFALEVTQKKDYYTRDEDKFATVAHGELSKDLMTKLYKAHLDDILENSLRTNILDFVKELSVEFIKQTFNTPFFDHLELNVNTYPIEFTDDQARNLIEGLIAHLGKGMSISVVNLPMTQLPPSIMKEQYVAVIMYDYAEWFNTHTEQIKKTPLREVGFYLPRIFHAGKPKQEYLEEAKRKKADCFDLMTKIMTPYAVLQYLPIAFFSADTPYNLLEYRELVK